MGDWPINFGFSHRCTGYPVASGAGTVGITVTAHASANTKGSWIELIASTAFAGCVNVIVHTYDGTACDYLIDIGIGDAGSEITLMNNILFSASNTPWAYSYPVFPVNIPAGTRVSARVQCDAGGKYIYASGMLIANGGFTFPGNLSVSDTYGATVADSGGISVDPGGSANTKGAWSEITSGISRSAKGIMLGVGDNSDPVRAGYPWWNIDVGIGAAGSEQVIVSDFMINAHSTQGCFRPKCSPFLPIMLPAGTRIAVRGQTNVTVEADRIFDAVIYTFS
jgi:hypothetical protein